MSSATFVCYILCPHAGVGHIGFGADPVFFSTHYLLNQSVDFDQTGIDTLLRGVKFNKFDDLDRIFKVTPAL